MKKSDPVAHLHVHTDYSILDGHSSIEPLAAEAARLGQPALAITDHGSLGGVRKHWEACRSVGVKPIVGCEFYVAPQSRFTKEIVRWGQPEQRSEDVSGQGAYTHGTVLATSDEGVRNLFRLYAASYADGFYRKPRIDLDLLGQHNGGLVATTGCAGGALATRIRLGQINEAKAHLSSLRDIFADRLYVEIMQHDNPIDAVINPHLITLSRDLDIPLLATNDSHYTLEGDAYAHDAMLCLQTFQKINGIRTFKFEGSGYHLRSHREMAAVFSDTPEAIRNTLVVAERVEEYREVFATKLRMPRYLGARDAGEQLTENCTAGLLFKGLPDNSVYNDRMTYELATVISLGFADYFLVLEDILREAKRRKIRVGPGRGSAGGSLVAYLLGITDLDPIVHGLLFERFLNPERASLPDIDVDIEDTRRDELLDWVRGKYGEKCVAQLGTYGTIGSKSALHDSARVLGLSRRLSDGLTYRLPPPKFGRQPTLSEGDWSNLSDDEQQVVDVAISVEGKNRNQGVHAAGVVISPEPLDSILPVHRPKGTEPLTTTFDMSDVEATGLVKYDFLGLKNLSIIENCVRGLDLPWDINVLSTDPRDLMDEKTYELLRSGHTLGVFQLDSPGMQQLLRALKPDSFSDISALLSVFRPGPMSANAHREYAKRKNEKA